jgi:uncharacterized membrane protein YhaH (DUF805 family)
VDELNPIEWAIRPFRRYADFSGRAPRAEYWWYVLAVGLVGLLLGLVDVLLLHRLAYGYYGPLGLAFTLAAIIPGLAVLVRRLHDTERSGWWALIRVPSYALLAAGWSPLQFITVLKMLPVPLAIVAAIAWCGVAIAVFVFMVLPGTEGPNRYGPDPYGRDQLEEVFA